MGRKYGLTIYITHYVWILVFHHAIQILKVSRAYDNPIFVSAMFISVVVLSIWSAPVFNLYIEKFSNISSKLFF